MPSVWPTSRSRSAILLRSTDSAEAELESAQITVLYTAERTFTKSLHLYDPDGNEVELYVDTSDTGNTSEAAASA